MKTLIQIAWASFLSIAAVVSQAATIVDIASFNGTNGVSPGCGVTIDSAGNMYGIAMQAPNSGTVDVWKIAAGVSPAKITTLATYSGPYWSTYGDVVTKVAVDGAGNLYGTNVFGGAGSGSIWEIPAGSTTLSNIVSFNRSNGYELDGGVIVDRFGNLWGTAQQGGSGSGGVVWNVKFGTVGATKTVTLYDYSSFSNPNCFGPASNVTLDGNGNVYGTAFRSNNGQGSVWEVAVGPKAPANVGTFNGSNGRVPITSVVIDSLGNLYGTTAVGGANSQGAVWEIKAGSNTISDIFSFNGSTPTGDPILDGSGNLFGTASAGPTKNGYIWEIPASRAQFITIASFNGSNGSNPCGVTLDPSGDLLGTAGGGASADGVVWELSGIATPPFQLAPHYPGEGGVHIIKPVL